MSKTRRNHSPRFKGKVALEAPWQTYITVPLTQAAAWSTGRG
ncbi:MAG: hypothetical protein ACYCQK_03860 [Acidiferrobacteraceae bacterium]